ncbi:MAG TPA: DUF4142 domain-containing protein, partial [Thermoanaerobaculia bacterium]|nr:DUF4142 domain-containing protein [Thermoanaerobaculia bacterium]
SLFAVLIAAVSFSGCATMVDPASGALTDAEITQIVLTANQGVIEDGQIAAARAASDAVKGFAGMIVQDHTAANLRITELVARAGITPVESALSRQLAANAGRTAEAIGTWRGTEFDRIFMETQVQLHRWFLSTIDENLIPSVRHPELRALLEAQRGSIAVHLARAQQVRSGMLAEGH